MTAKGEQIYFGDKPVSPEQKEQLVRGIFANVADNYDCMNDLMSAGMHRLWKEALIDWLAPHKNTELLDIAGGSGDIARCYLRRIESKGRAIVCDLSESMLRVGRANLDKSHRQQMPVDWVCANGEALPFADQLFDYVTIGFGARNVARLEQLLTEAKRVLRPGGRFLCLEFSKPTVSAFRKIYDLYSFSVIPRLGRYVADDEDSYRYLVESIRRFPDQKRFAEIMKEAGFARVTWRNLTFGVAALHSGWRL